MFMESWILRVWSPKLDVNIARNQKYSWIYEYAKNEFITYIKILS